MKPNIILLALAVFVAVACSQKEDPAPQPKSLDNLQITPAAEYTLSEKGGDIQVASLIGKGPLATDNVILRPSQGPDIVLPIKSVGNSSFTVSVPADFESGKYTFCIERDGTVREIKQVNMIITLAAPTDGPYVYGCVTCGGSPLPGVVVSDGFACTTTDANGKYILESPCPERAQFAFASVPTGYEPKTVAGLPVFFSKLPKYVKDTPRQADIELVKATRSQDEYRMFVTADLQIRPYASKWAEQMAFNTYDTAQDCFAEMRDIAATASCPCYSICLGDLVFNTPEANVKYNEWGQTLGFPFYAVIGNHDHVTSGTKTDDEAAVRFEQTFGPRNYSVNIGGVHFISIDNLIFELTDGKMGYSVGIEDAFLEWMKQDLSYLDKSTPVIVCAHAPFAAPGGVHNYPNSDKMFNMLAGFSEVYFWAGHVHENRFAILTSNGMTINSLTLVRTGGFQPPNEYLSPDGVPRGFAEISVKNKQVTWQYVPITRQTGKNNAKSLPAYTWRDWDYVNGKAVMRDGSGDLNRTYQMSVFPKGAYNDGYIYANVFFWDEKWSTPTISIGGTTASMQKYVGTYDPGYDEYMTHYESINANFKKEEFDHKTKIYHMFRYKVPTGASGSATVTVTDRFGNEYSRTVPAEKK